MEKYIHRLSFVITFVLVYIAAGYIYLSYKGFVYQEGSFELVKPANAAVSDEKNLAAPQSFATPIDSNIALNFEAQNVVGSKDAPLTIYEFSSFGCPHCADFHLNVLPKLSEQYFDTNKVRLVFIAFPLDRRSMQAAMLEHCLNPFDRPDFVNLIFSKQREWALARKAEVPFAAYAQNFGLKEQDFKACLKNDTLAKEIMFSRQEAIDKLKIEGTPAFLISDAYKNEIIYGVSSFKDFKQYLDERISLLEQAKKTSSDEQ